MRKISGPTYKPGEIVPISGQYVRIYRRDSGRLRNGPEITAVAG